MPDPNSFASRFDFSIDLRRPGFVPGPPAAVEALVRLQAPPRPARHAPPPLVLAIVLDASTAMPELSLEEAKACARRLVRKLGPADRACVVSIGGSARVLSPVAGPEARAALLEAIDAVQPDGSSSLHEGWLAAARLVGSCVSRGGVHRVLLLADGAAHRVERDLDALAQSCRELARQGVSTSTFDFGPARDRDVLRSLARAGGGESYGLGRHADAAAAIDAELARLANGCARGMVLKVHAPSGVEVVLRNDYERAVADPLGWRMPDLAYGEEAWAYLRLTVPNVYLADAVVKLPITLSLKAAGPAGAPLFFMTSLPPLHRMTRAALAATAPDPEIERRREELAAREVLALVERLRARGHWRAAHVHVERARRVFGGHAWWQDLLARMQMPPRSRADAGVDARRCAGESPAQCAPRSFPAFLRRQDARGR